MMSKIQNLNGTHNYLTNQTCANELFMMSKIQNLNGTHNTASITPSPIRVVYDVKDTKFEWNSQQADCNCFFYLGCLWCQRYKIWMELTTDNSRLLVWCLLFMMSKIQNLNGTHNIATCCWETPIVVYDVKDTKFEWNSQRISNV